MVSPQSLLKRNILVAAGSFESRLAISAALTERGYDVSAVSNGLAAYTAIPDGGFDLLLLSADTPGFEVPELCRLVRELSPVPIIIYPGSDQMGSRLEAFEAGADDYIVHGIEFEEVLARVTAVLRRFESRNEQEKQQGDEDEALAVTDSAAETGDAKGEDSDHQAKDSKLTARYLNRPKEYDVEPGTSVLVVDPNAEARNYTVRLLSKLGHEVIEAETGLQGALTVRKYMPKLVMTELNLKYGDGFELIRVLKSHPKTENIKVMVVTENGSPEYLEKARSLGIADYIVKPLSLPELSIRSDWALDQAA